MKDEAAYIITKTSVTNGMSGRTDAIKFEYFAPDEFKITVVKDGQLVDSLTVVGIVQASTKAMQYQKRIFDKDVVSTEEVYKSLQELKSKI